MSDESGTKPKAPKLRLSFAEGQIEGNYTNLAMVSHAPTEFVFDFAFIPPGLRDAKVISRVLLNPVNAKRFAKALQENLRRYEQRFGEIDINLGGPEPTLH